MQIITDGSRSRTDNTMKDEFMRGLSAQRSNVFTQKFGGTSKIDYVKPKFARTKLFCQYYKGNADYFSYDYRYIYPGGLRVKKYSEMYGLYNLVEYFMRMDPYKYRYITVFVNITNNLNTDAGDYSYHVASITKGTLTWKKKLQWLDEGRKLDTTVYSLQTKKIFEPKPDSL